MKNHLLEDLDFIDKADHEVAWQRGLDIIKEGPILRSKSGQHRGKKGSLLYQMGPILLKDKSRKMKTGCTGWRKLMIFPGPLGGFCPDCTI